MIIPLTKQRILVVSAYPGDAILACGGSMAAWANSGTEVYLLELSDSKLAEASIEAVNKSTECIQSAAKLLGLKEATISTDPDTVAVIISKIKEYNIKVIVTHHPDESRLVYKTCEAMLKSGVVDGLICFEPIEPLPRTSFRPTLLYDISAFISHKWSALKCFEGIDTRQAEISNRYWGGIKKVAYAEALELILGWNVG